MPCQCPAETSWKQLTCSESWKTQLAGAPQGRRAEWGKDNFVSSSFLFHSICPLLSSFGVCIFSLPSLEYLRLCFSARIFSCAFLPSTTVHAHSVLFHISLSCFCTCWKLPCSALASLCCPFSLPFWVFSLCCGQSPPCL